jgi:ribonuclease P protein subunit POP4
LLVAEAKNTALVGICGIVVHETENAFRIVTKQDQTRRESIFNSFSSWLHGCYLVIPKQNSIFTFGVPLYSVLSPTHTPESTSPSTRAFSDTRTVLEIPHLLFTLYGNQFRFRASERAGKKFKAKETIEL